MAYRCVIFDFDGTLADTEKFIVDIYNEIADKYGFERIDQQIYEQVKTMSIPQIIAALDISYKKAMSLMKAGQKLLRTRIESVEPFEENLGSILNTIEALSGPMGVISSNLKKNIRLFLKHQGVDNMAFIISSPLFSKEHKIRSIMRRRRLAPSEVLYVGDETRDIVSSHNAGVDVAAAAWGYTAEATLKAQNPTYIIHSIHDIISILKGEYPKEDISHAI